MLFSPVTLVKKYDYLSDKFKAAYKWLENTDLDNTPIGTYPITDGVYAMVQEYDTFPPEKGNFETHDKYFDIQYLISGREMFGVCKREGLKLKSENPDNDVSFYEDPEYSGNILLLPGDLIIVAPEDAHKPRLMAGEPGFVRKVVIKVRV